MTPVIFELTNGIDIGILRKITKQIALEIVRTLIKQTAILCPI